MRDVGVLMQPHVRVIRTNFEHPFWPNHESDEDNNCLVPHCRFDGIRPHTHVSNFQDVKTALVEDEARNGLIAATVMSEVAKGPHHHLIVSDEVRHLRALEAALSQCMAPTDGMPQVHVLIGKVKGKEREEIKARIASADSSITFATVAKEGMDIPVLDRIYLPFPVKNAAKVQQWIGRGTRIAEGKDDIIIFDFFDYLMDVFKQQFRSRRFKCYDKLGLEVDLGV